MLNFVLSCTWVNWKKKAECWSYISNYKCIENSSFTDIDSFGFDSTQTKHKEYLRNNQNAKTLSC